MKPINFSIGLSAVFNFFSKGAQHRPGAYLCRVGEMPHALVRRGTRLRTLLAILGAASLSAAPNPPIILDASGVANLRIETVEVDERDFETTVFAIGRIEEIPSHHSVLSSRVPGRVLSLNVFEGDSVAAGDIVATIETRQIGDPPPQVELRAPQGGVVVTSHIRLGQPVQPDAELMDISDRSSMWAVAKIPENEAARVKVGSQAHIRVPALGASTFEAKLIRFGVNADRGAGAVEGIFLIENKDGKLRPGMRAEFSVVLERRANVLAVPRKSIQGDPSNRVVFVKDFDLPNAFLRVPIVIGERNDRFVEVLSGLFPGDEVVTQGSYSLGFAGSGQGISLKEALDAAHGHEHNEDGSELTEADKAKQAASAEEGHAHEGADTLSRPLMIYAAVLTLLFLVVLQRLWNQRRA
ncbi:MAG: efflux RND transporter periplasmic adaptor subunit [Opitutae bacterium]|nr:efflux RND transporter periplasmic adaptor subunit [Opitutae bacterium]